MIYIIHKDGEPYVPGKDRLNWNGKPARNKKQVAKAYLSERNAKIALANVTSNTDGYEIVAYAPVERVEGNES